MSGRRPLRSAARALLVALAIAAALPAHAGPIVERIKAAGVIRCGGVARPGLAEPSPDGGPAAGLYPDLCRAVGAALLPPDGRVAFRASDDAAAFARMSAGADDLVFLDGGEILAERLAGTTILGPVVVFLETAVMVPDASEATRLADLRGEAICFLQGSRAHMSLEAAMAARGLDVTRMGFTETDEMFDAYAARKCEAVAGEAGDLAMARLSLEARGAKSRILAEPLATIPVYAVTPADDPQWAGIVAFAIFLLQRADLPSGGWSAGAAAAIAPRGADLGLADDWTTRALAGGTYAELYARNLGEGSRLRLRRGPNAPIEAGGLFVTPTRE